MLFISPPFGNYININNAKSISGSYTLHPREGLISQIFKNFALFTISSCKFYVRFY